MTIVTTLARQGVQGPAGLNPRGAWTTDTNYLKGDLVTYSGANYFALISNENVTPGTDDEVWEIFVTDQLRDGDQTIGGKKTFSTVPASGQDASAGTDLVRLSQIMTLLTERHPEPEDYGDTSGDDDAEAVQDWIDAMAAAGRAAVLPNRTYRCPNGLVIPSNLDLRGAGSASKLVLPITVSAGTKQRGMWVPPGTSRAMLRDLEIEIDLSGAIGGDDGEYGTGITLGQYYYPTSGVVSPVSGVTLERLKFTGGGSSFGHAICGMGRCNNVKAHDIEVENASSAFMFHWGAHSDSITDTIDTGSGRYSYHPHVIDLRQIRIDGTIRAGILSSCYDVTVDGIKGTATRESLVILPGDVCNAFAHPDEVDHVLSGHSIRNVHVRGLAATGAASPKNALTIRSWGISRITGDTDGTGAGKRRWLSYRGIELENIVLEGTSDLEFGASIVAQGVVADGLDLSDIAKNGIGLDINDSRDVKVRNFRTRCRTGMEIERCEMYDIEGTVSFPDRTIYSDTTLRGARIGGPTKTTTTSAEATAGATSLSLSSALGCVLIPGDIIDADGVEIIVAGNEMVRDTATTIPTEALPSTVASGATITRKQDGAGKVKLRVENATQSILLGANYSSGYEVHGLDLDATIIRHWSGGVLGNPVASRIHVDISSGGLTRRASSGTTVYDISVGAGATSNIFTGRVGMGETLSSYNVFTSGTSGNNAFGLLFGEAATGTMNKTAKSGGIPADIFLDTNRETDGTAVT